MAIEIHKEEILNLSERVQVKVIYEYRDAVMFNKEILRYEFKIQGQDWRPEIKIDLKNKTVSTSSFYFDLSTFNQDLKTIVDHYATLDLQDRSFLFHFYKLHQALYSNAPET